MEDGSGRDFFSLACFTMRILPDDLAASKVNSVQPRAVQRTLVTFSNIHKTNIAAAKHHGAPFFVRLKIGAPLGKVDCQACLWEEEAL